MQKLFKITGLLMILFIFAISQANGYPLKAEQESDTQSMLNSVSEIMEKLPIIWDKALMIYVFVLILRIIVSCIDLIYKFIELVKTFCKCDRK